MKCVNCGGPAEKVFASVLVCDGCHGQAEALVDRAQADMRRLLALLHEGIRVALIEKRFTGAVDAQGKMREALQTIVTLKEAAERRQHD